MPGRARPRHRPATESSSRHSPAAWGFFKTGTNGGLIASFGARTPTNLPEPAGTANDSIHRASAATAEWERTLI